MAKDTEEAPALPPASIDFNKLHAECKAGRKPETALKNAVIGDLPEEEAEEAPEAVAVEPETPAKAD